MGLPVVEWLQLWMILVLGLSAVVTVADSFELDGLDVYPPFLPEYVAQQDTIADLEFRVYFPFDTKPTTGIRVTPTCDSMVFSPSSFVFDATQSVYKFSLEPLASGSFTIEYLAQEESTAANSTTNVLFSQAIQVLEPPKAFDVNDLEWSGVILQNDLFDQPAPANNSNASYSSPFWGKLKHGNPSGACGAFGGDRALYFTPLGDRYAVTAPLNLLGFHGKMHFLPRLRKRVAANLRGSSAANRRKDSGEQFFLDALCIVATLGDAHIGPVPLGAEEPLEDGCDFMRYTVLVSSSTTDSSSSDFSVRDAPSCSYGTLMNGTTQLVPVTSNAKLQVVACGNGLVASDLVESALYNVHPRPPTFVFEYPKTTVSGMINVTIVPSDATSVGVLYTVGASDIPSCSTGKSAIQNAGNLTVEVKVSDVLRAVACCMDRKCDDSEVAVWGPLTVSAIAPVFSMVCSRVKPLTMTVDLQSVTMNAAIRCHVGSLSSPLTCASGGMEYTEPIEVSMASTTVYAISCLDGLQASEPMVIPVNLDSCCSGLDAYKYPSCAHVLLLADDFSKCVDTNKWDAITSQWGGEDVNGGVHASNVECVKDDQLGKNVLSLAAHGDLHPGTSPVGLHRSAADGTLRERTIDDGFLEWALEGTSTIPCDHQLERCPARRVGAVVSTKLELNAGVLILRLKPCDAFGTLTQVWWGKYEDKEEFAQQEVPFLPLWKAALYQAKTTSDVPFALSSPLSVTTAGGSGGDLSADNGFIEIGMQWNASEGRANLYVNGALVLKQIDNSTSSSSLLNSTLSLGVWFPNAIAGEPLFESCNVLVDSVQVFKMEIAGGRWCDFNESTGETQENAAVHSISCKSDVDCQQWVTQNCFMGIYEALCVAHHDELADFTNLDDEDNGDEEVVNGDATKPSQSSSASSSSASSSASTEASKFCHFQLQPTAYSSVSSTEMTARDQSLHLSDDE